MRKRFFVYIIILFLITFMGCKKNASTADQNDIQAEDTNSTIDPFSKNSKAKFQKFSGSSQLKIPLITWGADIITVYANGGSIKTAAGSIFDKYGLDIELFREDDFQNQVDRYIRGETPFLRGTMGMINMAADITKDNPALQLVVIFQHSWSAGGDALVVKSGINSVKDLKGKTISIQKYGPHIAYFTKLLSDAGVSIKDVNVVWTKDLVGPDGNTPMAKFYKENVDASFVIIPDALALTSSGTIGTGAEDSVKGAKILLSTKTANRIISDVYAVRKDYFDSNKDAIKNFTHALFIAEEEIKDLFKNKKSSEYQKAITSAAKIILDSEQAISDMDGMYYDAEMSGFKGNVKFFADKNNLRRFEKLTDEIQTSFVSLGLLKGKVDILQANWDYNEFKAGLKYAEGVDIPRFKKDEVQTIITRRQKQSAVEENGLFSFEIFFQPNQNEFSAESYKTEFNKVIEFAATYGGAIITIEGHSDPMGYLRKEKDGESEIVLNKIKQAAKNLSLSRANKVRDEIISYAKQSGISLDQTQFATIGHGINKPKFRIPETKNQWLENMRVEFKIIQIEAEEEAFQPLK